MQGGKIAEQRPDPPGADDAYPNLSTVPARPAPPDRDAMQKLTASLVGDRTNAQYTAEAAPLADPSSPSASPNLFGMGTLRPPAPPPAGPPAASASLPAASAPPAPPAPAAAPSRAPVAPVQAAPLEPSPPPASPPTPAPAAPAAPTATAPSGAELAPPPVATGPLPALPSEPPPRPGAAPSPPPPPAATLAPIPPSAASEAGGVLVGFPPGSSALSPTAAEAVKQFAARRGGASVVVTGYGDAVSADPGAQTAALSLALSRAQSVANALAAAGVPQTALRVGAEAAGRGASLRLLQ